MQAARQPFVQVPVVNTRSDHAAGNAVAHTYTRSDRQLTASTGHDADWRGRYAEAYRQQNKDFLRFAATGEFPAIASGCWDGYAAAAVAEAGVRALQSGSRQPVSMIARPEFYA